MIKDLVQYFLRQGLQCGSDTGPLPFDLGRFGRTCSAPLLRSVLVRLFWTSVVPLRSNISHLLLWRFGFGDGQDEVLWGMDDDMDNYPCLCK